MIKTRQPKMMVARRPIQSAKSPAIRAPKKVPAERIEVISDFFQAGRVNASFSACVAPEPGMGMPVYRLMKYFMPMTPEMYPESYPKKIPPNEAKAHMRYALRVIGASIRSKSAVALR